MILFSPYQAVTSGMPATPTAVYHTPEATLAAALRMHRALGIERGVIVQSTAYGTDYRILVDSLVEAGPSYRGIAVIDDSVTDADLQRMDESGVRGARFNFLKVLNIRPSPATFKRCLARVRELGWLVKIHATYEDLVEVEPLVGELPVDVVIDHLGYPDFTQPIDQPGVRFIQNLLRRENWWLMLSNGDRYSLTGYPWDDAVPFARTFIETAPDQVIWGSDWPHPLVITDMPMKNDGDLLELLYRYAPDENIRHKILVDNPRALFAFGS